MTMPVLTRQRNTIIGIAQTDVAVHIRVLFTLSIGTLISTIIGGWYLLSLPDASQIPAVDFSAAYSSDSSNSLALTWTAPGDDGDVGQATSYSIRYSTSPITSGTWSSLQQVLSPPDPQPVGSAESMTLTGLSPDTLYYIALRSTDDMGNISGLSNIASASTSCVEAWSCSAWSSCTNGTKTRTCTDNNDCGTTTTKPTTSQSCTTSAPPTCTEDWSCSSWSSCTDGTQTRTCTDDNDCGTTDDKPGTSRSCDVPSMPPEPEQPPQDTEPPSEEPPVGGEPVFQQTFIVAVPGSGGPTVRVLDTGGTVRSQFTAFPSDLTGGLNVTVCDLGSDGIDEIVVAPADGYRPIVRVFSWEGRFLTEFLAYDAAFRGGVTLACGNADNKGASEIITAVQSGGGANIRIFSWVGSSYVPVIKNFFAYDPHVRGGFNVALTNMDGSSTREIVTVPSKNTGGPHVRLFEYIGKEFLPKILGFMAYDPHFHGGVSFCEGDVNADGKRELFTAPEPGGGPHIRKFGHRGDGTIGLQDPGFFVFDPGNRDGLSCALGDVNFNGGDELFVAPRGGGEARVKIYKPDGSQVLGEFLAFPANMQNGVRIAAGQFEAPE